MEFREIHPWTLNPQEAVELQETLRGRLILEELREEFSRIAGADVSYDKVSDQAFAAVLVFRLSDFELQEQVVVHQQIGFPYIPGLLSFREVPALLQAFRKIRNEPDVILLDGQGISHPRRFGLASHVGLILDRPTIGCAKSRLVGSHGEVDNSRGAFAPLEYQGELVGAVLRTKANTKPLYISPGHRMDIPSALRIVLETCRGYRLPEPVRRAHLAVTRARKGSING